jgi:hypothetical protein
LQRNQVPLCSEISCRFAPIYADEAKFVFEKGCKQLIFGTGQDGMASLSPEASAFFEQKGCKIIAEPTPNAIQIFNTSKKAKVGLFHVTC